MVRASLFALVLLAACGGTRDGAADARVVHLTDAGPDADPTDAPVDAWPCGVVGDLTLPPEMQVVYRTEQGASLVVDGATLPLVDPIQGGKVLLIGLRVKNVDLCESSIQIAIKDLVNGRVAGVERRSVTWGLAPDGFAEPADPVTFYDYANVPLCPNGNIAQDIDGNPWQLEAQFYNGNLITAEQLLTITPSCADVVDPTQCQCECAMDNTGSCGGFGGG
ncbi:MAG: hypothetical protein K8W52_06815 [Deltaproteobacteria bacterium]|nr:hypothetical protein [Deltaproteobacteria bacterium]